MYLQRLPQPASEPRPQPHEGTVTRPVVVLQRQTSCRHTHRGDISETEAQDFHSFVNADLKAKRSKDLLALRSLPSELPTEITVCFVVMVRKNNLVQRCYIKIMKGHITNW